MRTILITCAWLLALGYFSIALIGANSDYKVAQKTKCEQLASIVALQAKIVVLCYENSNCPNLQDEAERLVYFEERRIRHCPTSPKMTTPGELPAVKV